MRSIFGGLGGASASSSAKQRVPTAEGMSSEEESSAPSTHPQSPASNQMIKDSASRLISYVEAEGGEGEEGTAGCADDGEESYYDEEVDEHTDQVPDSNDQQSSQALADDEAINGKNLEY